MSQSISIADLVGGGGRPVLPPRPYNLLDLFCGAGGTSAGAIEAVRAVGFTPRVTGVNHWDRACETFELNHPEMPRPLCTGVDDINPRNLFKPGELKLLWASPECTHHSVARGGMPINDQSRATAWCVVKYADALLPPVILVENVPEFRTWGPVDRRTKRPIVSKKGAIFKAWLNALVSLGYRVEHRVLCAADYGDPTTRQRLFVQAVRGPRKIVWPNPTHGIPGRPWVAAREIIDWSLVCPSIYERKRPLSAKTMARIYAGLAKFGMAPFVAGAGGSEYAGKPRSIDRPMSTVTTENHRALVQPFILSQRSNAGARSTEAPLSTVTTTSRGIGLAQPFLVKLRGTNDGADLASPAPTITACGNHLGLAQPFLVQVAHGNGGDAAGDARRSRSLGEPMAVVCGNRGEWALCEPSLLPQQQGGVLRSVDEPVPTVAAAGAIALVEPFLVKYYGTGGSRSVAEPLDTVTTKDRYGLARPVVVVDGEEYLLDIGFRMLQPHELAGAQGFRPDYEFAGNKTEQVRQIGNAVPRGLARALVTAVLAQTPDVWPLIGGQA